MTLPVTKGPGKVIPQEEARETWTPPGRDSLPCRHNHSTDPPLTVLPVRDCGTAGTHPARPNSASQPTTPRILRERHYRSVVVDCLGSPSLRRQATAERIVLSAARAPPHTMSRQQEPSCFTEFPPTIICDSKSSILLLLGKSRARQDYIPERI